MEHHPFQSLSQAAAPPLLTLQLLTRLAERRVARSALRGCAALKRRAVEALRLQESATEHWAPGVGGKSYGRWCPSSLAKWSKEVWKSNFRQYAEMEKQRCEEFPEVRR